MYERVKENEDTGLSSLERTGKNWNDYKIEIHPFEALGCIRVKVTRGDEHINLTFDDIADLDHFAYELRQASFDYKVNHSNDNKQRNQT